MTKKTKTKTKKEDSITIKSDEVIYRRSNGVEVKMPIGKATIEDDELNIDRVYRTPIMYKKNEAQSLVINSAGKTDDGTIIIMGKVVEKLDKPLSA